MKIEEFLPGEAIIRVDENELLLLANALNEVQNGIDITEFHTRLGAGKENATTLHKQLKEALRLVRTSRSAKDL